MTKINNFCFVWFVNEIVIWHIRGVDLAGLINFDVSSPFGASYAIAVVANNSRGFVVMRQYWLTGDGNYWTSFQSLSSYGMFCLPPWLHWSFVLKFYGIKTLSGSRFSRACSVCSGGSASNGIAADGRGGGGHLWKKFPPNHSMCSQMMSY